MTKLKSRFSPRLTWQYNVMKVKLKSFHIVTCFSCCLSGWGRLLNSTSILSAKKHLSKPFYPWGCQQFPKLADWPKWVVHSEVCMGTTSKMSSLRNFTITTSSSQLQALTFASLGTEGYLKSGSIEPPARVRQWWSDIILRGICLSYSYIPSRETS